MEHHAASARGLQLIRVSPDRFILKRGLRELSVSGAAAAAVVEPLVGMLDAARGREEILAAFSADLRPDAERLLRALEQRGLLAAGAGAPGEAGMEGALRAAFFENFGAAGAEAPARLREAEVIVVGVSLIGRALALGLLECGVGRVIVAEHPVLTNHMVPGAWARGGGRLVYSDRVPEDDALRGASLLCAASDLGEVDALLALSRAAIRVERPFLPAWIHGMVGAVGPLCHPRETACLRCYRLRADSNDPKYELARAVRQHLSASPEARASVGLLSPMPDVVGRIAAMEAAKHIGGFVPADALGRVLEINLLAFGAGARRVLKIPRCPDCGEQNRRAPTALTHGPQIPDRR